MSTIAKITGAEFDAMVMRGAFDCIGPKTVYRKIEIIVAANPLAPRCLPSAVLDTRELFEVL